MKRYKRLFPTLLVTFLVLPSAIYASNISDIPSKIDEYKQGVIHILNYVIIIAEFLFCSKILIKDYISGRRSLGTSLFHCAIALFMGLALYLVINL